MTDMRPPRGGAPVGHLADLLPVEAGTVLYLRLWCEGPKSRAEVWNDFARALGAGPGRRAVKSFETLCDLCTTHARRPLMRHHVTCRCLGADEACFANFVAAASEGAREDALMIASAMVRADVATLLVTLAEDFGLALKRMSTEAPAPAASPAWHNQTSH